MNEYKNCTDGELVALTLLGMDPPYAELVTRHEKRVIGAAMSVTRNIYMAEDAAQDAFVLAWMKLDMLRDGDRFCPFVCRIAKNCAKNAIARAREAVFADIPEDAEYSSDIEDALALKDSVEKLPEKVRRAVILHYFDGLSVSEIADATDSPVGTVKWHLSEGRRILRSELGIMNEKDTDTMVHRVMARAAELKRSLVFGYNDSDFRKKYDALIEDIESLPESKEKNHALADALISGYWYLQSPVARDPHLSPIIKEAALKGENEDVLCMALSNECVDMTVPEKIAHIRDVQIPLLAEKGLEKTLGDAYFRLGHFLFHGGDDPEGGFEAYEKALRHLPPSDVKYAEVKARAELEALRLRDEALPRDHTPLSEINSHIRAYGLKLAVEDGSLRITDQARYFSEYNHKPRPCDGNVFTTAPTIDGFFFSAGVRVGEAREYANGSFVKFSHRGSAVHTPAGHFENCSLWQTGHGYYAVDTYYCDGVGIVMIPLGDEGRIVLEDYHIEGGGGMLPLFPGNRWAYRLERPDGTCRTVSRFEVIHSDGDGTVISGISYTDMHTFDTASWDDMIFHMRHCFYRILPDCGAEAIGVPYSAKYAVATADTPYRRAYTDGFLRVIDRIVETDFDTNPSRTEAGVFTAFEVSFLGKCIYAGDVTPRFVPGMEVPFYTTLRKIHEDEGDAPESIYLGDHYVGWSNSDYRGDKIAAVELGNLVSEWHIMFRKFWDDGWTRNGEVVIDRRQTIGTVRAKFTDAGTFTVRGGTFDGCVRVDLEIDVFRKSSRFASTNKRTYILAPGVGIIRMDELVSGTVYELAEHRGTGKGYFPLREGIFRRFECVSNDPDFIAYTAMSVERHPSGRLALIQHRHGCVRVNK